MWILIRQRFWTIIISIVVIILLLALIFGGKPGKKTNIIGDAAGIIVSPIQGAFSWVVGNIGDTFNYLGQLGKNSDDNIALKLRIQELENEERTSADLQQENERLRTLLDLKVKQKELNTVGAEIVAKDPGNWADVFTVDKGSLDGVKVNAPVIDVSGLVGYVFDVGTTWAKVSTIIDPSSSTGVVLTRTGEQIIVEGDADLYKSGLCKMTFIPSNSNIAVGDSVETSGLGGVYHKGLFVGHVKQILSNKNGISIEAIIEPVADFKRLREVLIIKLD